MTGYNGEDKINDTVEGEEGTQEGGFAFDTDFDVAEEYKETPLIPAGTYEGYVTGIKPDGEKNSLVWEVTLKADEDVVMSDGETPVNGNTVFFTNWFPRAGDETARTKNGRMTKRQSKINMLNDFQKGMAISMNTSKEIIEAIQNAEWIGIEVLIDIEIRTYEGRISNQAKKMVAA